MAGYLKLLVSDKKSGQKEVFDSETPLKRCVP